MSKYFLLIPKKIVRYAADKVFPRCAFYLFSQRCPNQVNYSRQYSYLLKLVFAKMFPKKQQMKVWIKINHNSEVGFTTGNLFNTVTLGPILKKKNNGRI